MSTPSGTVTFLFTDIEGSTQLWENHPKAMQDALARHNILIEQAIMAQDGLVFKTMGDAFCAAFWTAPQALSAALNAQRAIVAEPWLSEVTLRVRMALHTETAIERDGDYFGPPLNRVARLLSVGHGGQTLLSLASYELTRDALPPETALQDLGTHALRDLSRPEQVYQLTHPDLPALFPPLRSLDNPEMPNNLPQQMTSFVGREKELTQIKGLLDTTRLLTLTGSGGAGKTRLSLHAAVDVLESYPDGVWLIELAPITDPVLVPQVVANVLGVRGQPGQLLTKSLADWLKVKRLLLILDNCEHLLSACASLVDTLLRTCPHIRILASSREGLNVLGEQTYRVPSLSMPDVQTPLTPETLSQYEAVRLFIERIILVRPDFTVTNQNAPAVASVCQRVDGIPLALELAAARIRSLSVEEVNNRLDNRFRLLTGGSRTALPRQQTLRALIDWSYDLLTAPEKSLLCRLSAFAGGWILEASEAVCVGEDIEDWEVFDLLTSLVDKSLVSPEAEAGRTRYRLLETVRQYGRDKLVESGDSIAVRDNHAGYFLTFAEDAVSHLRGADQGKWLARLEMEHDNFRAALAWFAEMPDEAGALAHLRLAGVLQRFWMMRGHWSEGRVHLDQALEAPGAQGRTLERAKALISDGILASMQGDSEQGRLLSDEGLAIARELGDRQGIADALSSLGNIAYQLSDYDQARLRHEESLSLSRELGQTDGVAMTLRNLGNIAYEQGDYVQSRLRHEESLSLNRELENRAGIANALLSLGNIAYEQGDYARSRSLSEESLSINRELGHKGGIANSLLNLGNIVCRQGEYDLACTLSEECLVIARELGHKGGITLVLNNLGSIAKDQQDYERAYPLYRESLTMARDTEDKRMISYILEGIAHLSALQDQPRRAACLWGAAEALREATDTPLLGIEQAELAAWTTEARSALGEDEFALSWAEGRALTWQQAVDEALAL